MNLIVLLAFFEGIVILQGIIAYQLGYLTMAQAKKRYHPATKKVGVWIEHAGMWGDMCIVSPVTAWIISTYGNHWSTLGISIGVVVSIVMSIAMLREWKKGNEKVDEVFFTQQGRISSVGWLHALYMFIVLVVVIQFYFFTPHVLITHSAILWISILLTIHLFLGSVLPEYHTFKKVSSGSVVSMIVGWVLIWIGYFLM